MAFIGNKDGPRQSDIIERLGPDYFGITPTQLADDADFCRDEESRGEVMPVLCGDDGQYYLLFSGPGGTQQMFYLEEHGFTLTGKVKIQPSAARS